MHDWFKVLLSLSLSGSALLLVVMGLCRLLRHKVSKRWQYYIWLVVIARLLLPVAPQWNLVDALLDRAASTAPPPMVEPISQEQNDTVSHGQFPTQAGQPDEAKPAATGEAAAGTLPDSSGQNTTTAPPDLSTLVQYLWVPWLVVAVALLLRKITAYQSFAAYITAGKTGVDDPALLNRFGVLCEEMGVRRHIELHQNPLAASPLLSGILRPCIVLPTADISDWEFSYIIRHELVHYRRGDIYYKWLAQVALCVHWFNPLVHWMVAELNRFCELSCDEAVIRNLDDAGKRRYGDTLLESLKTTGNYKASLASITLNETVSQLKERLLSIMNFKKKPVWVIACSVSLSILLCVASFFLGAYVGRTGALEQEQMTPPPTVLDEEDVPMDEPPLPSAPEEDGAAPPASAADTSQGPSAPETSSSGADTNGAGAAIAGDIDAIHIDLTNSFVTVQQGDAFRVEVSPKLEDHVSWQLQDKTVVITDDFGENLRLPEWNASDYTVRVTLPRDSKVYESLRASSGPGGISLSGLNARTVELSSAGEMTVDRVQAEAMKLSDAFGDVSVRDTKVTGTIECTGDNGIFVEDTTCGSLIMNMNFGAAVVRNSSIYTAFTFTGDAVKEFTGIDAGSMVVTSDFGSTTMTNSRITGNLYHEGQKATFTNVIASGVELRQQYGNITLRDCAISDGMTLHNEGGNADIESDIKGDILLYAGEFGSIDLRNTGAKRSQYAVEATGFSQRDGFVNASYIIDGQVFTADYRYSGSAPYKLGIYANREYGNAATITFAE